ncbi:DUF1176 domain-containing protein [Lichenicola sp.]|uniref:DUF1176 domain-containing protein n=1 Tax=Lichenicola sp. TaxID=2804529 RepID=UPI003B001202
MLCPADGLAASRGTAGPHEEPASRAFGDWLATCDNALDCTLDGFGADDTQATLIIGRPRGAAPVVTLLLQPAPLPPPASVRMVGARRGVAVTVRVQPAGASGAERGDLGAGAVAALLPVLRAGGRLLLQAERPGGRQASLGVIRLAGLAAALDWIDARQRRVPEALPLVMAVPDGPVPAPDPHHLPAGVTALASVAACRREDADDPANDASAWALSSTVTLWQVPCGSGNFDRASLFVLADRATGRVAPAGFTAPPQVGAGPPGVLINAETGEDGHAITAIAPGRGLGDCGDLRRYRWDGQRFRLVTARLMIACRGLAPEDWPLVYRSRLETPPGAAAP